MSNDFEMPDFSAQPKPREKVGSRGKLVAIIVAFVLLFGVLIGVGVWWFIRDAGGSRIAGGIPPEGFPTGEKILSGPQCLDISPGPITLGRLHMVPEGVYKKHTKRNVSRKGIFKKYQKVNV